MSGHPHSRGFCYNKATEPTTMPPAVAAQDTPSLRGSLKTQAASMGPLSGGREAETHVFQQTAALIYSNLQKEEKLMTKEFYFFTSF